MDVAWLMLRQLPVDFYKLMSFRRDATLACEVLGDRSEALLANTDKVSTSVEGSHV